MTGLSPELIWQRVQNLLPEQDAFHSLSLCVGFSGGLDSTVLLHLLSERLSGHLSKRLSEQKQQSLTQPQPYNLKAIHINHQLQDDAGLWADFCQDFCLTRNIPFLAINVALSDSNKTGVEAAARNARYAAFKENLLSEDILLTAHHRDDQIETVFLQLLRGTGIEGAAAISPSSKLGDKILLRPLLGFDREQLEEYAKKHKLKWIDDPSNFEIDYNRNYLRHEVLPIIEKRWPAYRQTIQRFANNARSATSVLNETISQDYAVCFNAENNTLKIDGLLELGLETRLMVIRYWIKQHNFSMPGEAVLLQIHGVLYAEDDANPIVEWGDAIVRRYRNEIFLISRKKHTVETNDFFWDMKVDYTIKNLGVLCSQKALGQGLQDKYADVPVNITFRRGGEKCRPAGRQGTHSLKKLLQEYAVPPWQRDHIPIIMIDNQIAAVVGLFYCAPFAVKKDEVGLVLKLSL